MLKHHKSISDLCSSLGSDEEVDPSEISKSASVFARCSKSVQGAMFWMFLFNVQIAQGAMFLMFLLNVQIVQGAMFPMFLLNVQIVQGAALLR